MSSLKGRSRKPQSRNPFVNFNLDTLTTGLVLAIYKILFLMLVSMYEKESCDVTADIDNVFFWRKQKDWCMEFNLGLLQIEGCEETSIVPRGSDIEILPSANNNSSSKKDKRPILMEVTLKSHPSEKSE